MAQNRIGSKKIAKYREQTNLDILAALTRGGTNHRIDLMLADGSVVHWFRDGTMHTSESITWDAKKLIT